MDFAAIAKTFQDLKTTRRNEPLGVLHDVGVLAASCLTVLSRQCEFEPIAFLGTGDKKYSVASQSRGSISFSRPLNDELFVRDPVEFSDIWATFLRALVNSRGKFRLGGIAGDDCVRACYTAVMSYASCIDIHRPGDRGTPGVMLEMTVGPTLSTLLDTTEAGAVRIEIEGTGEFETVPVDLTFPRNDRLTLVVPTKISTRERISQAFVHQRILEAARPGKYATVLVIGNETNVMFPKGISHAERIPAIAQVKETLVPNTIALYAKYVAHIVGMYYLDPPLRYLSGDCPGVPNVRRLDVLFAEDLPSIFNRSASTA
jgi:hypothetical protein